MRFMQVTPKAPKPSAADARIKPDSLFLYVTRSNVIRTFPTVSVIGENTMAQHRPDVGKKVKNKLRGEVGNKCANPGCPNTKTHLHHIKEWAVYGTHDAKDMVAVCPTCHDAIHHGNLAIPDETLYSWKAASRVDRSRTGHLYVEPGGEQVLMLGSIGVTADKRAMVFKLSEGSYVNLSLEDDQVTLLDMRISSARGDELVKVAKSGHFKATENEEVTVVTRPGALHVSVPCSPTFIPLWLIWGIHANAPDFIRMPVKIFSVEILSPGLIRLEGIWAHGDRAIVVTSDKLQFYSNGAKHPLEIVGKGKGSTLHFVGDQAINGVPMFAYR